MPQHRETPGRLRPLKKNQAVNYATTFGAHQDVAAIARSGLFQPRRKKARVSAASLEQPPTATRAKVVAAELLVQLLIAVDNPAPSLDVSFAKDSLDGA